LLDKAEAALRRLSDERRSLSFNRERRPREPGGAGHGPK
jgi:hypothetical protein